MFTSLSFCLSKIYLELITFDRQIMNNGAWGAHKVFVVPRGKQQPH